MPQKTNFNINPYYDDYSVDKNFYKVLFKPGFPVQARELTTLQSIFQNQIESFGSHLFKEGSMVIPGSITYDSSYYSLKINSTHLGLDVSLYLDKLIGVRIQGQNSGVTAVIKNYSIPPNDGVEYITLYIKYNTTGSDYETSRFEDGEILIALDNITYGNTTINSGDTIASLIDLNASATGASVNLAQGVYFIRGTFVNVENSTIILDPYNNSPSYRVGLSIQEEIITSDEDLSLNDNARGFSNFSSPGADRFRIKTFLTKKILDDFDDKNFVELIRIDRGEIKKLQDKSVYSIIKDYFAQRTFDESGNYALNQFNVDVLNSLNDNINNDGVYQSTQKTEQGNIPSDDSLVVRVSPGKAYVRGYDIDIPGSTNLDVPKPRETANVSAALVPYEFGSKLTVNNVYGSPYVGISTSGTKISLFGVRKGSAGTGSTSIGEARVYGFNVTDAAYQNASTNWDLYLFDIQTYTNLVLNLPLDSSNAPKGTYIKGLSSGASGYLSSAASSATVTLSNTSGTFIVGEQVSINGTTVISRSINQIFAFTKDDIKSVFQNAPGITPAMKVNFSADSVLTPRIAPDFTASDTITIGTAGIATSPGRSFIGISTNSIIGYQKPNQNLITYNRVVRVFPEGNRIELGSVPSISNVNDGTLPTSELNVSFTLQTPNVVDGANTSMYATLTNQNVSSVNLSDANLVISTQIRERTTNANGEMTLTIANTGITSAFFEPFDEEKYSIIYGNGTIESLSSDQVTITNNGTQLNITGLLASQPATTTVNVTLRKNIVSNKNKIFTRSEKLSVNKSNSGISTAISGLSSSQFYGLRVEDEEISLNLPDVTNVIAIYESLDTSAPILDKLSFPNGLSLNTQSILGEKIRGVTSRAIGQIVTRLSNGVDIEFVYLNSNKFIAGEDVIFEESQIRAQLLDVTLGVYSNLTNNYTLDKGQKNQYYDYSKIVRLPGAAAPSRQLLVIFNYYDVPINDSGDIITVNSYQSERFEKDIPLLPNGRRATDTLDFRPRVSRFTDTNKSPFTFEDKSFASPPFSYVISPGESSFVSYSYYLPRKDRVVLNKLGQISVIQGVSSPNPTLPVNVEEAMDLATIDYPAYLYDPDDVQITLVDNKRYTMRDIGQLEDRIENLEITTSLSLLELNTQTLQVQDAEGLTRFKTGFFADDFKDNAFIELSDPDVNCTVDTARKTLGPKVDFWSLGLQLALDPTINTETADFDTNLNLLDSNVRKTGDLITLDYEETLWLRQNLASRIENVNPFNVIEYSGDIVLNPATDNWVRNIYINNRRTVFSGGREYTYVEDVRVSSQPDPYMRSRNVQFSAGALRPLTRHYHFLDAIDNLDVVPKLIEITMQSGVFQVGETVRGISHIVTDLEIFRARIATANHKSGPYNNPEKIYSTNPYNTSQTLPSSYSASSTVLNIDVRSLADESLTTYGGALAVGSRLVGQTSNAVAVVSNIRLITDQTGSLQGSFFIRDPNTTPTPEVRVRSGQRVFKLTQSSTNQPAIPGDAASVSDAQTTYTANGIVQTQTTSYVTVRNPPPPPPRRGKDPLAQSFTVDETGAFLTSLDVYFQSKDSTANLFVEIRTVELGTPTNQLVQDFARVVLEPSDIEVSNDASVATRITFPSPIYLQPGVEYCFVLLSPNSDAYNVWIAKMGETTITTQSLPQAEAVVVSQQYSRGSLFKSQNGTIWTASQYEDMKFRLHKANFTSNDGSVYWYNPPLRANNLSVENPIPILTENPINGLPRKLKVTFSSGTTALPTELSVGRKVSHGSAGLPESTGFIEKIGGPISTVSIANTGIGYTSSSTTYTGVSLYPITGNGTGAQATIVCSDGGVTGVTITSAGNGYSVGDILGITTSSVQRGKDGRISISAISSTDTLYLTNVQGENFSGNLLVYSGDAAIAPSPAVTISNSTQLGPLHSGNIFEVTQYNHSMHSGNNVIQIVGCSPDTAPVSLAGNLTANSTLISLASTSGFDTFEGITTSRGYIQVGTEIIEYNSINSGNTLGISSRGLDGSNIQSHNSGTVCRKYECNGVSLTKINTTHEMADNPEIQSYKTMDKYYLAFDRGSRSSGSTMLNFKSNGAFGGSAVSASKNIQYSNILPQFSTITPGQNTTISARVRTVTGTSAGGNEVSFQDKGYEDVEINRTKFLPDVRMVCSEINEKRYLTSLPKNKSLTFKIRMQSDDPNLSPVLDVSNSLVVLGRNRINKPIADYVLDGRSNQISGDPHGSVYISKRIDLEQNASALKVLVGVNRPSQADFRVLYKLFKSDSSEITQSYILFPGYDNLVDTDNDGYGNRVVDVSKNSGLPDRFVRPNSENQFSEYQFTADNLEPFSGFVIKIVMNSTNESKPVTLKDLRVIALA